MTMYCINHQLSFPAERSEGKGIKLEALLRLPSCEQTLWNALCRRHRRSGEPHLAAQERPDRRLHQEVWRAHAGLVRRMERYPRCDRSGEADKRLESCLEDQADREAEPDLEGLVRGFPSVKK